MFKRILLPTDGSELSQRAILAGVAFAKELGAEVVGLAVSPEFRIFTYNPQYLEQSKQEFALATQQKASDDLQHVEEAAQASGVPCSNVRITSDEPYQAIIDTARNRQCDLIVMASHGRRGVKGLLLGSETQKVLVHSAIPVLVYR